MAAHIIPSQVLGIVAEHCRDVSVDDLRSADSIRPSVIGAKALAVYWLRKECDLDDDGIAAEIHVPSAKVGELIQGIEKLAKTDQAFVEFLITVQQIFFGALKRGEFPPAHRVGYIEPVPSIRRRLASAQGIAYLEESHDREPSLRTRKEYCAAKRQNRILSCGIGYNERMTQDAIIQAVRHYFPNVPSGSLFKTTTLGTGEALLAREIMILLLWACCAYPDERIFKVLYSRGSANPKALTWKIITLRKRVGGKEEFRSYLLAVFALAELALEGKDLPADERYSSRSTASFSAFSPAALAAALEVKFTAFSMEAMAAALSVDFGLGGKKE